MATTTLTRRKAGAATEAPKRSDERAGRTRFGKRTLPVDLQRLEAATKGVRLRPVGKRG